MAYLLHRKLNHGHRWRTDPLYQAPMVEASDTQFFVGDFVSVSWDQNTTITAKIIHFYTKVRSQVHNHNKNMCCISCVLFPFVLQGIYTQCVC